MKKASIIVLIAFCLLLSACGTGENASGVNSALSKLTGAMPQSSEQGAEQSNATVNYENILKDVIGEEYFEGRAIMRAENEEIFGEMCAVFQVGINTDERFTTEEWLAVSAAANVYKYDVALDVWESFSATEQQGEQAVNVNVSVGDCIYALNEIYTAEFSAEYYNEADMVKNAVYESEEAFNNGDAPALLINLNEAVPDGYFHDPLSISYLPVYSFSSKEEVLEHFSLYFTQNVINELRLSMEYDFLEFDGELHLARGGMGYGTYTIDFDTIDYTNMQHNKLILNMLYLGEFTTDKTLVEFAEDDGYLKIDSYNYLLMYDFFNLNRSWENIQVPDFLAFAKGNNYPTAIDDLKTSETEIERYIVDYLGDYYEVLPEYVKLLTLLGFEVIIDGYEGFYSMEKIIDGYLITVNAYYMNEQDGVTVELIRQ